MNDQLGRAVNLQGEARRIVSLVPSISETVWELGAESRLVGITRYCVHPCSLLESKTVVGGTKKIVPDRILKLEPDLILLNKEENSEQIFKQCSTIAPIYVSDIASLADAMQMISDLGKLLGQNQKSSELNQAIGHQLDLLDRISVKPLKVLYLIWNKPIMGVGGDTFIHHMLQRSGFDNVLEGEIRYPELDKDRIKELDPDLILLSSEPYEFKEEDVIAFAKAYKTKTLLVDGEMFSWYGSRLVEALKYLKRLREVVYATWARSS